MRRFFRRILEACVSIFGSKIVDQRTGEQMAKALLFCWGGRIYVIGYEGKDQVMPVFLPQERITFWKRQIGFATHPPPDFSSESKSGPRE